MFNLLLVGRFRGLELGIVGFRGRIGAIWPVSVGVLPEFGD